MKKTKLIIIIFFGIVLVWIIINCIPNLIYSNSGISASHGTTGNGSLENAYQINYSTKNSKYFSFISYYLMDNGFVNSKLYQTLIDSYKECEKTCSETKFRIMECSDKQGGKLYLHRTHQNGLSVDFMVPKTKNGRQSRFYDRIGLLHYLLNFDSSGKFNLNKKISIDFETIGKHIISLDNAAKKNGLVISKVILKIDLKDDLYNTESGKEVKKRGIYFAKYLPKYIDIMHDDHYHIDFKYKN
jgi:penicillin-insensitive murein endopeptidase